MTLADIKASEVFDGLVIDDVAITVTMEDEPFVTVNNPPTFDLDCDNDGTDDDPIFYAQPNTYMQGTVYV